MEKTQKKISFLRSRSDKTVEKSYTQSNSEPIRIIQIRAYLQILKLESDIQIQKSMEKAIQLRITKPGNIPAPQNATGQEEAMDIRQPWGRSSRERKGTESRKWNQTEKDSGISGVCTDRI